MSTRNRWAKAPLDVNHDGHVDYLAYDEDGVAVFMKGPLPFTELMSINEQSGPSALVASRTGTVVDLNSDGWQDYFISNGNGNVRPNSNVSIVLYLLGASGQ